jgi:hypothetical protein
VCGQFGQQAGMNITVECSSEGISDEMQAKRCEVAHTIQPALCLPCIGSLSGRLRAGGMQLRRRSTNRKRTHIYCKLMRRNSESSSSHTRFTIPTCTAVAPARPLPSPITSFQKPTCNLFGVPHERSNNHDTTGPLYMIYIFRGDSEMVDYNK